MADTTLFANPGETYAQYEARLGFPQPSGEITGLKSPETVTGPISPLEPPKVNPITGQPMQSQYPNQPNYVAPAPGTITGSATTNTGMFNAKGQMVDANGNVVTVPAPTGQSALDPITKQIQDNANKIDTAITDAQTNLQNVLNGTIPLTPAQQAQVTALQQQFDQLRAEQLIVNKNYQAGITQAGITSGRNVYAPEIETGNITNAINVGIQKIAQIDQKASAAVAQMEDAFQTQNYKNIKDAYDLYTSALKMKGDNLQQMYDDVRNAIKDAQDAKSQSLKDLIAATASDLEQQKFTWQQAQDKIKNAVDQANLDINQRKQLLAESQAALQAKIVGMIGAASQNAPTKNNLTGIINPADQKKYLDQFPPEIQANIKAIANYQAPLSVFPTRLYKGTTGLTQAQYLAAVSQYTGEDFNAMNYPIRQKFMSNWTTGGQAALRSSANALTQHLAELLNAGNALGSGDIQKLNSLKNWVNEQTGNPKITAFQLAADAVAGEYSKMIVTNLGSVQGASQEDRDRALGIIKANLSPGQMTAIGNTIANLMRDRLNTVSDIYQGAMGKPPNDILLPSTIQKLDELKNLGVTTDFSYLLPKNAYSNLTPEQLLSAGSSSNSSSTTDNTQLLNQLFQLMGQPIQ